MNCRSEVIEPQLVGKVVSRFKEMPEGFFRLEFVDGSHIDFHGGTVGTENADPWYEVSRA